MDIDNRDNTEDHFASLRKRMVETQIERRGVNEPSVLDAMRTVPRHLFVPEQYRQDSYTDGPLPIGRGQTISQPYVVASMTEYLKPNTRSRILEIGTGSGYQTAVLAEIVREVYTVEIIAELQEDARAILERLRYRNIYYRVGDGYRGWPEEAPFDGIVVTAAADGVPPDLEAQLTEGGRMIIPVQRGIYGSQDLVLVEKLGGVVKRESLYAVRFVDMQRPGDSD